ncbi:hypothetical protein BGW39_006808 [Mortierella sp. 14UC]|nr:hypothetical protein BGW39_006808 [Mortierella sp. 14UC]
MDSLSRLPIECLQQILELLNAEDATPFALANLLTMNKHIASVTLPILYRDPFRKAFHSNIYGRQRNKLSKGPAYHSHTQELLTRMLLDRLPVADLCRRPKVLSLGLTATVNPNNKDSSSINNNTDDNDALHCPSLLLPSITSSSTSFNYLAHIRHLNIIRNGLVALPHWTESGIPDGLSPGLLTYLLSDEFGKICKSDPTQARRVETELGPTIDSDVYYYYQMVLDQEALWCLASPILEQLQSFTIPHMFSVKNYLEVVGRFKNLERLRFMTHTPFEGPLSDDDYHASNNSATRTPTATHNGKAIQGMFWFVQEHTRLFPGRLKTVLCLEDFWGPDWRERPGLRNLIWEDICRLLPPLHKPTSLGVENWVQFLAHARTIDLTDVNEFSSWNLPEDWYGRSSAYFDKDDKERSVLQRCRKLKKLNLRVFYEGMFKWAVQEKKNMVESLVSLERINVDDSEIANVDSSDLDDIVFAFSQTLTSLSIKQLSFSDTNILGQGWVELPTLTHLCLTADTRRIVLDPQVYACLPNLVSIQLSDPTLHYRCQHIVPYSPGNQLTKFESLQLEGWTALTFDPSTLSSALALKSMTISAHRMNYQTYYVDELTYVPPLEELYKSYGIETGPEAGAVAKAKADANADVTTMTVPALPGIIRPQWTWDWDLPLLTDLTLTSEFAVLFDFKMLSRCPSLTSLYLDIRSTLTSNNYGPPPPPPQPQKTPILPAQSEQCICLPALTRLDLYGEWILGDDTLLKQLFSAETGVFPNVKEICLVKWVLPSLDAVIKYFRASTAACIVSNNNYNNYNNSGDGVHLEISDPTKKKARTLGIYQTDIQYRRGCNDEKEGDITPPSNLLITSCSTDYIFKFLPDDYINDGNDSDDCDDGSSWMVPVESWAA